MKDHKSQQQTGISRRKVGVSRRSFVKSAATIAAVASTVSLDPFLGDTKTIAEASSEKRAAVNRTNDCFNYRKSTAVAERINVGPQADNGDAARFTDFSGNYSKALLHDSL